MTRGVGTAARSGHCRECGERTARRIPAGDIRPRCTCSRCGAIEYENPKLLVTCALFEDDRILWIRRAAAPYRDRWAIPGGFVECGETPAEAAAREVREETYLRVAPADLSLHSVISLPDLQQIHVAMMAPLPSHGYRPSPEASDVRMFSRGDLRRHWLAYPAEALQLLNQMYDVLSHGEPPRAGAGLWDIRGDDALAALSPHDDLGF